MSCATKTIAILGNVGAGKTTLCGHLCKGALRSRKVPGCKAKLSEALLDDKSRPWDAMGRRLFSSLSRVFRTTVARETTRGIDVAPDTASESQTSCPAANTPTTLIDTPGATCLFVRGEDETATRSLLMAGEADVLVVVADAKNLRRSLLLFLQACEFQLPTVLVLNMVDEAERLGLQYDIEQLAAAVTVKITPLDITEDRVAEKMTALFEQAEIPSVRVAYPQAAEEALEKLTALLQESSIPPRALGLLLLAGESMWWALSLGVCAGSSATMTGATAVPVTAGLLEEAGFSLTYKRFAETGIPLMFVFLLISSSYLALAIPLYHPG